MNSKMVKKHNNVSLKRKYIYLFTECLLSVYYMPGSDISLGAMLMNKIGKGCILMEVAYFLLKYACFESM